MNTHAHRDELGAFFAHVITDGSGCWIWTGKGGEYGSWCGPDGRACPAHRVAYRWFCGAVPDGLVLDHLCSVPRCVNPSHLEAVTSGENIRRGFAVIRQRRMSNPAYRTNPIRHHVRAVREHVGLSQAELAHRAGVTQCMVSNIERSNRSPSLEVAIAVADALSVDALDLFWGDRNDADTSLLPTGGR